MKKISLIVLAMMIAAPAMAKGFERNYGLAGCGLGSIIMGKKGGQVSAATSNQSTGYNQTFGITSGTSNCMDAASTASASRMDKFVVANQVALASDIARGEGETLASIGALMNCGDARIGSAMQGNFSRIFPSHDVPANEVTDSIISVIMEDATLSAQCKITG